MKTKEQLIKEIEELKKQKESLIEKRDKIENDFEQSEKYKTLSEEINKLEEEEKGFSKEIQKIDEDINFKFLTEDSTYPSWSSTYEKNIHPEIINAIKQTFDFKRLSGSSIETIVRNLINHQKSIDEKRKELREKEDKLSIEGNNKESEKWELKNELTRDAQKEINDLHNLIEEKEKELVRIKLDEGKEIKKEELQTPYLKKQVLNEYREECEHNFIKVFEKLGGKNKNEKNKIHK